MKVGANGLPDPDQIETFVAAAAGPVALEIGPGGDLFYVDMNGGTIRRIRSTARPASDRGHLSQPDQRPGAAHGAVRRDGSATPRTAR